MNNDLKQIKHYLETKKEDISGVTDTGTCLDPGFSDVYPVKYKGKNSDQNIWFNYRTWCIINNIEKHEVYQMEIFMHKYLHCEEETFDLKKTLVYHIEHENPQYQLIREDVLRFRPYIQTNQALMEFPSIPDDFFGTSDINVIAGGGSKKFDDFEVLDLNPHPFLNNLSFIDRVVTVVILVCEYFNCDYLQGIHDIVGCLAFLRDQNNLPLIYHLILSTNIIKRWSPFFTISKSIPSRINCSRTNSSVNHIFTSDTTLKDHCRNNSENIDSEESYSKFRHIFEKIKIEDSQTDIWYLQKLFEDDFTSFIDERKTESFEIMTETTIQENSHNSEYIDLHISGVKSLKTNLDDSGGQGDSFVENNFAIEHLIKMCNVFHIIGSYHIPKIIAEVDQFIGTTTWCCNFFVTCGSCYFYEVPNVLLFWLQLMFCSERTIYRPTMYPVIPEGLQMAGFLLSVLKAASPILNHNISLLFTSDFKLDIGINLRLGIVSTLQPNLFLNKLNSEPSLINFQIEETLASTIAKDKKCMAIDIFQLILVMDNILVKTPISLQFEVRDTFEVINQSKSTLYTHNEDQFTINRFIHVLESEEIINYDSKTNLELFQKTNYKSYIEGPTQIKSCITGRDIILVDLLTHSLLFKQYIQGNLESNLNLNSLSESKDLLTNLFISRDKKQKYILDENFSALLLLPILRHCLKSIRIVKIPIEKDPIHSELFITQGALQQFFEFATRRQFTLTAQCRPSMWIVVGPKTSNLLNSFFSKMLQNNIKGVQTICPGDLITTLLSHHFSGGNSMDMIWGDIVSSSLINQVTLLGKQEYICEQIQSLLAHQNKIKNLNSEDKVTEGEKYTNISSLSDSRSSENNSYNLELLSEQYDID
ncbi:hypothetical protein cand_020130 [Cryptosporidium andersoni]|uniref:Uncharacterized protein n=1 Tax=Cryptosporidium andersoni TaxID=117008 RepID=A0A1J4MTA9_9CRYT|nr:hypothetical protein cand_020130 [Cryptosporidium andersoni]